MNIYEQVIAVFGADTQIRKTVEELTELSLALQHYPEKDNVDHICEEVADVEIMLSQIRVLVNENQIQRHKAKKLARLRKLVHEFDEVEVISHHPDCEIMATGAPVCTCNQDQPKAAREGV